MSHIKAPFALIASLQGIRQPPDASCVESSMSSVSCPRCLRSVPSYAGFASDDFVPHGTLQTPLIPARIAAVAEGGEELEVLDASLQLVGDSFGAGDEIVHFEEALFLGGVKRERHDQRVRQRLQ